MKNKRFKVIWQQVSSEDAELRIQRAFDMLLGEYFGQPYTNQLKTTIDRVPKKPYNQINERQTTYFTGSGSSTSRPTLPTNVSTIRSKISKNQKAQGL